MSNDTEQVKNQTAVPGRMRLSCHQLDENKNMAMAYASFSSPWCGVVATVAHVPFERCGEVRAELRPLSSDSFGLFLMLGDEELAAEVRRTP